jgi:hypothetical protein
MSKAYVFLYAKTPQIFRKILMSSWRYVEIELRCKFAEQEKRVNAAMSVATIVEPTCVCRSWRFGGAGCKQPKWQHCHYNRKNTSYVYFSQAVQHALLNNSLLIQMLT